MKKIYNLNKSIFNSHNFAFFRLYSELLLVSDYSIIDINDLRQV
jgi:hypothetical protein